MRRIFFFTAFILAVAVPALAEEGNITMGISQPSEVLAGDSTFFTVDVTNNYFSTDYFSLSVYPSLWISIEDGISAFRLSNGQTKSLKIFISPPMDARAANYIYTVEAAKSTGEKARKDVTLSVQQRFRSALLADASLSCNECINSVTVYAKVKNIGNAPIEDAKIIFSVGSYRKTMPVEKFFQGEEKTVSATFLVGSWQPKLYPVSVELFGPAYEKKTFEFLVPEVKNLVVKKSTANIWWGSTTYMLVKNDGNVEDSLEVRPDSGENPFVALYPREKPASITGGAIAWYATLKPGDSVTYSYSSVFWPLPVAVILVLLSSIFGYSAMTALEIRKEVLGRGDIFGVSLRLRNRGSAASGVVVRDIVPHGLSIVPAFETLKPIMRKISEGTELIWRVGHIAKGEETVLHYKINSGGVGAVLPPAQLKAVRQNSAIVKNSNYTAVPRKLGAQPQKVKVVVQE